MEGERRVKLESDIRALTQFLCNNYPLAETPKSTEFKNRFQIALSSMAILLTYRGGHHPLCVLGDFRHLDDVQLLVLGGSAQKSEESLKSREGMSAQRISISFLPTNPLTARSKQDHEDEMKAIESGQVKKVMDGLDLAVVSSSGKTLEELAEIDVPQEGDGLTPFGHAQDVVAALHGFHQRVTQDRSSVDDSRSLLKVFFVRRCFHKLRTRVLSDTSIFQNRDNRPKHFGDLLRSWVSEELDRRAAGEIGTNPIDACVASISAPSYIRVWALKGKLAPNSDSKWELNSSNIHLWVSCLSSILHTLLSCVSGETSPTTARFINILASLEALAWFEHTGFLQQILEETSLQQFLASQYKPIESLASKPSLTSLTILPSEPVITTTTKEESSQNKKSSQTTSKETGLMEDVPNDDVSDLASEEVAQVFPRYLKGITAWNSAISTLTGSKWLHRSDMTFQVHQLLSPLATNTNMTNLKQLAKDLEIVVEKGQKPKKSITQPPNFKGTVHCEALVFSLAYLARQSEQDPFQDGFLKKFFECCSPCIGTSRKPCWMCAQLHSILCPEGVPQIENSHGIIHAWNPPPNLPISVLEELRRRLVEKFKIVLWSGSNLSKSQQSSPGTSSTGLVDDRWEISKETIVL